MGKRWQEVSLILGTIILVGGVITYTDLLGALFQLKGMDYTYSGWSKFLSKNIWSLSPIIN